MHVVSVGIFSPLTLLSSKLFTIRHPRFRRPTYPRIKAESLDAGVLTSSVAEVRGTTRHYGMVSIHIKYMYLLPRSTAYANLALNQLTVRAYSGLNSWTFIKTQLPTGLWSFDRSSAELSDG